MWLHVCASVCFVKYYLHFSSCWLWKTLTFWGKPPLCVCNQSSFHQQLNSFMLWIEWMEMIQVIQIKIKRWKQTLNKHRIWECILGLTTARASPCGSCAAISFKMFYKSWLMYFSAQILLSLQTRLLTGTGWNSVIPLFVYASTVSGEQPMLVCLGVWDLLSARWCQSTGGSFMKWWLMQCRTKRQFITKCVTTVNKYKYESCRLAILGSNV